ncbi:G-type lectin S-receptor-like serine/threonine-protein kinase At4g27290 isoform X2 [Phalaenopsis equestris]|uniref:G-type lectin S-receptor-like serine/threonine-protein kinase At4g27290 isoform X2 n=1 Tax=Phalaenopsis equestris TaxID=78828 RepID=UPI0009E202C9|nr:G-type lectin S-receptor-like serine/threonine-protein kinase At4g27290 isoform X2 [Phalaenopsis equestris]
MKSIQTQQLILFFAPIALFTTLTSGGGDTLNSSTILYDGDTLVSFSGVFALGFFSPTNSSTRRYVAIWYNKIPTHDIVWVANRNSPITESTAALTLSSDGKLVVIDGNSTVYWSSFTSPAINETKTSIVNPIAQLLDTGNLVVRGVNNEYIWQSFDHPTDTFLAGMKLGYDLRSGLIRNITSWASLSDPSPGPYTANLHLSGVPQLVTTEGSTWFWRGGPWIGAGFSGSPETRTFAFFTITFVSNADEVVYFYKPIGNQITRLILTPDGNGERLLWLDPPGQWSLFWQEPDDHCDHYGYCGAFGICNASNLPMCNCLHGFQPIYPANWVMMDWSGGCVRKTELDCDRNGTRSSTDGFVPVSAVKLPDTSVAVEDRWLELDACRERCLMNCSCTAYSSANFTGAGSGCIMWMGQLNDLRVYSNNPHVIYLRLAVADLVSNQSHIKKAAAIMVPIVVSFSVAALLIGCLLLRCWRKRRSLDSSGEETKESTATNTDMELPLFDFETVADATNNFSEDNKLGEGGFGSVYMGKTDDGQEIAVKRLSESSTQGLDEFKNEVMLIVKLQHRNLVRLLGCCVQRQEKMLIYEYMPNKSLDTFLFDQEMVPKISDFGLARIFGGNEAKSQTKRVVGTYGYMSPEYVLDGIFSMKSDVFSFGVLTLEIISGQKNRGDYISQTYYHLLQQAWRLWKEDNAMELLDETIENSYSVNEVLRCIKVALLCVQDRPEDRPLMSDIILMLTSNNEVLPDPKCPAFVAKAESSSTKRQSPSVSNATLTLTLGRFFGSNPRTHLQTGE